MIAQKGVRFSNAFSTINSTDPSFTTIFTGKHPLSHGLRHHAKMVTATEKSYTTNLKFLPEILKEHDFTTIGIDWLGKWHRRGYDYYAGVKNSLTDSVQPDSEAEKNKNASLDQKERVKIAYSNLKPKRFKDLIFPSRGSWYYYLPSELRRYIRTVALSANTKSGKSLSGRKKRPFLTDSAGLSDLAIRYIREFAGKQNFFLFVHYWDNHIPYTAPRSYVRDFLKNHDYPKTKISTILKELGGTKAEYLINRTVRGKLPKTAGEIMAHYDASIKYVDSNINRIYKTIEETGILDDTLILITADHGESHIEHDIYFDHHGLYDPQLKIPLIMHHPELPTGSVYDEFVQHFDIVPTILELTRIKDTGVKLDGMSLMNLTKGRGWDRDFVVAEEMSAHEKRMIRDKNYKYIKALNQEKCYLCMKYHSRGDEFYDLQADPDEKVNIIDNPKHKQYKIRLEEYISALEKPKEGRQVKFEDEEEVNKRLEALGYI